MAIALVLCRVWDMTTADMPGIGPQGILAAVGTSYAITWLFRRQFAAPDVKRKFWLPFLTILTAVPIWSLILFTLAAGNSMVQGRHDLFDGFGFFVFAGLITSLTVGLPLTYPAAYLTQILAARYAKPGPA